MKRDRPEEAEEGPNKLQRSSGDLQHETANGADSVSKPSSKVRKGTECPYLDTIARQVQSICTFYRHRYFYCRSPTSRDYGF